MGEIIQGRKPLGLSPFGANSPGMREQTSAIGGEFTERQTRTPSAFSVNRTKQSEKLGLRRSRAQFGS
jgi:hypothetical protein